MKLNEVIITENAFTDALKRKAFDITGQQTSWGRQGKDLLAKQIFIDKVENLIGMNLTSASKSGVRVDPAYLTNLINGYLKQQGITDGIPANWQNTVNQVATQAAQKNKKAVSQLANIIYQIVSSETVSKQAPSSAGGGGAQSTQTTQTTQTINQVVQMIRQLATQGNTVGLQTIANAANRSLSRLAKQGATQQTATPPSSGQQNVPPISIGGSPITPGHPSYARMAAAAQRAGAVPESKNPVKSWNKV